MLVQQVVCYFFVVLNRVANPDDKLNYGTDILIPQSSECTFTKNWDNRQPAPNTTHFTPNMLEDYPHTWGWVDNAMNWFKVNMLRRTVEFVTNSYTKFKTYYNGDTVLHVTGNLKIVIEKDLYIEVRGSRDEIVYNHAYEHILGQCVRKVEKTELREAKQGITDIGKFIKEN